MQNAEKIKKNDESELKRKRERGIGKCTENAYPHFYTRFHLHIIFMIHIAFPDCIKTITQLFGHEFPRDEDLQRPCARQYTRLVCAVHNRVDHLVSKRTEHERLKINLVFDATRVYLDRPFPNLLIVNLMDHDHEPIIPYALAFHSVQQSVSDCGLELRSEEPGFHDDIAVQRLDEKHDTNTWCLNDLVYYKVPEVAPHQLS